MQFRDLKAQYMELKPEIDRAIDEVIQSTNFISGKQITELEDELAEYVGVKHCITCANGTDALSVSLMCLGVKEGDAVFVPDFTFFASGEVVAFHGAVPIFVDVDSTTYNMDVKSLEQAIQAVLKEGKLVPRVIMAVDLFGQPANYEEIQEIADKYKIYILEDGAQGFGGAIKGKKACSFGVISTTSFFPAKPLGCYGDGGAIFTDNNEWAEKARSLCIHGKGKDKYDNIYIGVNSRLDTMQAAILKVKFKAFCGFELEKVNELAKYYTKILKEYVIVPMVLNGYYSSWAQYTIQLTDKEQRDSILMFLKEKNIPSMIYYVKPMHLQTAFSDMDCVKVDLVVTSKLCDTVLSLPIHPYMSLYEVETVADVIINCLDRI